MIKDRFVRGGKVFFSVRGFKAELGRLQHYIEAEELDPETNMPVRYYPLSTVIDWNKVDCDGSPTAIVTQYGKGFLNPKDKVVVSITEVFFHATNELDIISFTQTYGGGIATSSLNGLVRGDMPDWGFDDYGIYNPENGALRVLTPEEEALPPTRGQYATHTLASLLPPDPYIEPEEEVTQE